MGMIKDRTNKEITEAEGIKEKWQEYTEELYKKRSWWSDGVVTHLQQDILEYKIERTLGNNTTNEDSGGDEIPAELLQIFKDDAVKVLHSICQHIWKTQQWPQDWKRSVFIPIAKKGNDKECANYRTIVVISEAHKVMLKIFQARLQK